jgi:hypothetical protein
MAFSCIVSQLLWTWPSIASEEELPWNSVVLVYGLMSVISELPVSSTDSSKFESEIEVLIASAVLSVIFVILPSSVQVRR